MTSTAKHPDSVTDPAKRRPPSTDFLRSLEEEAVRIRERAGVEPLGPLDPWAVLDQLGLTIMTTDELEGMTPELRAQVRKLTPKEWSGGGMPLPDGDLYILLHPDQTPERARITTMEEVAHEHYGHEPTAITQLPSGGFKRSFDQRVEQEAYWTAAAALLPMKAVGLAVYQGKHEDELAKEYGVSIELVQFRIKILGLWKHYTRRAA